MTDVTALTLSEVSEAIHSRDISSVEATQAYLDRIVRDNDAVNAFVTVIPDQALADAERADRDLAAGNDRGPLHGVPIAHKDLYATRGVRTTGGSRMHETYVPDQDATVVAQWREAGTVLLGKLNTHEFAYGPTNAVSMFGPARNPWAPTHISGGSSGGSGAALALGMCAGATGSDTGGSIRIPAACCGISGIKPTYGRASRVGIFTLCWTLDHPGPMARSVRDLALLLQPIARPDPLDPTTVDRPAPDYAAELDQPIRGVRIGIPTRYFYDQALPEVADTVRAEVERLRDAGAEVREIDIPHVEHAANAALALYLSEATAYHEQDQVERAHLYEDATRSLIEVGNYVLAKDYIHAQQYRRVLGEALAQVLTEVDVLAMPTLPITATPLEQDSITIRGVEQPVFAALLRNTEPFNLTGSPTLSIPCGFSAENLPISLQLVGPAFGEAMVLRVGHAYQQMTDWHRRQPTV